MNKMIELKEYDFNTSKFTSSVLDYVNKHNLWGIWVPKLYGGLECSFKEGLNKLQELAKTDGSLGWTVTLCSGANFFIGNLKPNIASEIFKPNETTILGGSGGVFGEAHKVEGGYQIDGTWHYATGANYLTHFTLNAKIFENGIQVLNEEGQPLVLSFILPKSKVEVIENWDTIGLKASVTHSFKVVNALVSEDFSFLYNVSYHNQAIFKIPFTVFADLTLLVNYIGMAQHFLAESQYKQEHATYLELKSSVTKAEGKLYELADSIEQQISVGENISQSFIDEVHATGSESVKELSGNIVALFPFLGVKAVRESNGLHQIFNDFFTATQHHIFTR